MKFNSETPPEKLEKFTAYIDSRWGQLNDLSLTVVNDGIKYLFYINAGGCVAMITFIGADGIRQLNWPWYVLTLFFLGVVFVGVLNFARYHSIDYIFRGWQSDVNTFYSGNLGFSEMCKNDNIRVKKTLWLPVLAYVAFTLFIAGGCVGFYNYHQLIRESPKVAEDQKRNHVPTKAPVPPTPQPPKQ